MGNEPLLKPLIDIPRMADLCQQMLTQALDAFVRKDAALARSVARRDDEIDALYVQVFRELLTYALQDPKTVQRALNLLFAAHNLERIGDRITNIAERASCFKRNVWGLLVSRNQGAGDHTLVWLVHMPSYNVILSIGL